MALMSIEQFADFIGLSKRSIELLIHDDRLSGLNRISTRIVVIDTEQAKILPKEGRTRREDGSPIGRSKKLKNVEVVK